MDYKISFYSYKDIHKLKDVWKYLEKGSNMTYFQTYDWYDMLTRHTVRDIPFISQTKVALIEDYTNNPIMIAPLWIVKHPKWKDVKSGVYLWGRLGWSDYLNLIYRDVEDSVFDYLVRKIKVLFGLDVCYFEQIREQTQFSNYLKSKAKIDSSIQCVFCKLLNSKETYWNSLSKSVRQNIRTAKNRLTRDGLSITFVFDDKFYDVNLMSAMRSKRLAKKQAKPAMRRRDLYLENIYHFFGLYFKAPQYLPFIDDLNSHVMSAYINNQLVAFFNYGYDEVQKNIVVMAAGVDETFAKYSPGFLLIESFIEELCEKDFVKIVDFTRGTEGYKFALGGEICLLNTYKI